MKLKHYVLGLLGALIVLFGFTLGALAALGFFLICTVLGGIIYVRVENVWQQVEARRASQEADTKAAGNNQEKSEISFPDGRSLTRTGLRDCQPVARFNVSEAQ